MQISVMFDPKKTHKQKQKENEIEIEKENKERYEIKGELTIG